MTLPYTTPSGHTYQVPTDWESLRRHVTDWQQSFLEHWDDAECPPNPFEDKAVVTLMWNVLCEAQRARKLIY